MIKSKILRFFKLLYLKIFRIQDSPQKIAIGFGLGVFLGILPGTGPIAALTLAVILRVNKISAVIGGLLTNTWINVATFLLAIKIGSLLLGLNWQQVQTQISAVLKNFHFSHLLESPMLGILLPLFLGYLAIGLLAGFIAYALILIILKIFRKK